MTLVGMKVGGPELNGIVALGLTLDGSFTSGRWMEIEILAGSVVDTSVVPDPPELLPSVAILQEVGVPVASTVLIRMAASYETWLSVVEGDLVGAMDRRAVSIEGDEAVFIRYMRLIMTLIQLGGSHLSASEAAAQDDILDQSHRSLNG